MQNWVGRVCDDIIAAFKDEPFRADLNQKTREGRALRYKIRIAMKE